MSPLPDPPATPSPAPPPTPQPAPPGTEAKPSEPAKATTTKAAKPEPKSKLKRRLLMAGAGLLVLALLFWAFKPRPLAVEVAQVSQGRFERAVQEYGKTRVQDRYMVSAPLAGRLGRLDLRQGDRIAKGDIVARLWPMAPALLDERTRASQAAGSAALEAAVAGSQANRRRAQAAVDQARVDLQRSEALARQGFVSPTLNEAGRLSLRLRLQELESAHQQALAAQHELEQAQAAGRAFGPQAAGGRQPSFALVSPVSGQVLRILQQSEAAVPAGAGLLELGDPKRLEVVVDLLTEDATEVKAGAPVQLLNWGGSQALAGQVRWVEPAAFTKVSALGVEEQRVNVLIALSAPPAQWQALGDGYKVDVRILVQVVEQAVMVPVSALFPMGAQSGLFVLEQEDRAVLKQITVAARNGVQAWIKDGKDGLKVGSTVIVYPDSKLKDGAKVVARGK